MGVSAHEQRRQQQECLVCDNGTLRVRIGQHNGLPALHLDACDAAGAWMPMAYTIPSVDLRLHTRRRSRVWYIFEPLLLDGETRGVIAHAGDGAHTLTCTLCLDDTGACCRQQVEVTDAPAALTVRWRLAPAFTGTALRWPTAPVDGAALAANPAAFMQQGAQLAALLPDLEETAGYAARLEPHLGRARGWSYTVAPERPDAPLRLACLLCLDARALPARGYQALVRVLGKREALRLLPGLTLDPVPAALPPLPPVSAAPWQPFHDEGTPAEIAARVAHALLQTAGAWPRLEEALCWLDRLCLHQRVVEAGDGLPLGSFGDGPAWAAVAPWMPVLLLEAFRLTGSDEYACRARAALHALPPAARQHAFGAIYPRFGDLFVQADYRAVTALADLEHLAVALDDRDLALTVAATAPRPLRLVVEGSEASYQLCVNGIDLGEFAAEQLRAGIMLPEM